MKTMNRYTYLLLAVLVAFFTVQPVMAQQERDKNLIRSEKNGWEFEVKAGVNIGGAAPLPMPREVRKIKSYNPKFNGTVEGLATYWFRNGHWGLSSGLKFEEKGMETGARVKNYHTEVTYGDQKVEGYFTGYNKTDYNETFLTIPLMMNYRFNKAWKVRAGLSCSFRLDGEFSGYVSDGYLRNGTPVGERITFSDGSRATYDFSDDLRDVQWNVMLGASWRAYKHFSLSADLSWGLNDIFRESFKTVSFNLYPIYLNIGFGYTF